MATEIGKDPVVLRPVVQRFAELMERQLRWHDEKYRGESWHGETDPAGLFYHAAEELGDLAKELRNRGDGTNYSRTPLLAKEAADVANMVMMIADVCGGLE